MKSFDIVRLSPSHLKELNEIISSGRPRSRKVLLAMALIWLDCAKDGPGLTDNYVSNSLGLSLKTIGDLKKLFFEGGPIHAVTQTAPKKEISHNRSKIDLSFEEQLIALANSEAPGGRDRWSVRLLAKQATELNLIGSISHMTVYRLLKKHNFNLAGD
jgi:hypothetical protein